MAVTNLLQGNYRLLGKITGLKLVELWTTLIYQKLNKNDSELHLKVITFTSTCAFSLTEPVLVSQYVAFFRDRRVLCCTVPANMRQDENNSSPLVLQDPGSILQWQGIQTLTTALY